VANWATQHGLQDQAGATLLATAIIENDLYWVALGDSRIYLVRNSRVFQINVDHVYAAELDRRAEYGEMEIVDAMRDPDRPALTSYLGMNPPPLIDRNIRPFQLQSGDWVFLFSDGLYNGLREDDFKLIDSGDPQSVCETLVDHVLSRKIKNQDNLTVMALAISKSSNPSWFGQFKRIWSK
jgi:protein phosphatase